MNILIRNEITTDEIEIGDVTIAAFLDAEHTSHTEQYIVSALRKAGALTISLVAEYDKKIIGHVAISPVSISDGSKNWYGLGPISVLPEFQSKGIGTLLMNKALDNLRNMQAKGCVLLGDPNYYCRFGFKANSNLVLPDVPAEYFQALSFTNEVTKGNMTYHEAFNAIG